MQDHTRETKRHVTIVVCALMIFGSLAILPAILQTGSPTIAPNSPAGSGLSPFVAEGGNTAIACSDVTTCTTAAITNVDAGDTLVVVVTEFTTSRGDPSAVEEVTAGGYQDLTLVGTTTCVAGSGHGVAAVYGLSDVPSLASAKFMVNYSSASYYTIHALDVEGVAVAPFETAGAGVCSSAAGTTGTATVNTTVPDDLVILAMEVRASTSFVASGGDTLVNQAATTGADLDSGALLDEVDGATGSISLSATFTTASWAAIAIALKTAPLMSGTVSPPTAALDAGQAVGLATTAASGGAAPYTYQWYHATSASTCASGTVIPGATGQSYATPGLAVGTYYYCVWATDNSTPTHEVAYSNVATVTVNTSLSVAIVPNAPSIDSGQTVLLTAEPSGGTGPYTFAWYSGPRCSGTVLATTQAYTSPVLTANQTFCAAGTDSAYVPETANATATVTVNSTASTGSGSGSGSGSGHGTSPGSGLPAYFYPVIGVLAALAAAALLWALVARRARKVTFVESGLPGGTRWSITFKGEVRDSSSSSITFNAAKGEHPYSVNKVSGYVPSPASGTLKVDRDPADVKITFTNLPP